MDASYPLERACAFRQCRTGWKLRDFTKQRTAEEDIGAHCGEIRRHGHIHYAESRKYLYNIDIVGSGGKA